jgi:hypothetical protein
MKSPRCVGPCLSATLVLLAVLFAHDARAAVGEIKDLRGEATAATDGSVQNLRVGMALEVGQRIVTGPNARAVLQFEDGTVITLGEKTEFRVTEFRVKSYHYGAQSNLGAAAFELLRGVFRAVTGRLGQAQHPDFTVSTVVATLGVRGTDFWAGFYFSEALDVAMFEGKGVYVQNSAGRVDLVAPGYGTTVRSANTPPQPPKHWGQSKIDAAKRAVSLEPVASPGPKSGFGDDFY